MVLPVTLLFIISTATTVINIFCSSIIYMNIVISLLIRRTQLMKNTEAHNKVCISL